MKWRNYTVYTVTDEVIDKVIERGLLMADLTSYNGPANIHRDR